MDIAWNLSDSIYQDIHDQLDNLKDKLTLYHLGIGGIEVTQAIQYYHSAEHLTDPADQGADNAVRLVSGKPAWVRVYLWSLGGISGVTGTLTIERRRHGVMWVPVATLSPQAPALTSVPASATTDYATMRGNIGETLNFIIPAAEMIGTLRLTADVSAGAFSTQRSLTIEVTLRQTLQLAGVMIDYDGPSSMAPGAPDIQIPAPTLADLQAMATTSLTLYPVQATAQFRIGGTLQLTEHLQDTVFPASGCGDAWNRLHAAVANARTADGNQPGWIYYGLLPTGVPMGPVGGCGGGGVGVGPMNAPGTLAHEAGHAAGLAHAPAGGAPNPDPNYPVYEPYPAASIGEYGLNVNTGAVANPQVFKDFMSYAGPSWIGLYHYDKLLDNALLNPVTVGIDTVWWKDIVWEEYRKWPWFKIPQPPEPPFPPDPPPWEMELAVYPPEPPMEKVISLIVRVEGDEIAEVMHVARTMAHTRLAQAEPTRFTASLLGAEGERLAEAPLMRLLRQPSGCDSGAGERPSCYLAQAFVADVGAGKGFEIRDGDKSVWRREAPSKPVRIEAFSAKLVWRDEKEEVLHLDWKASGTPEEFWVRWSGDGETWRTIQTGLTADRADLDLSALPPGEVRVQLVAHDGFFSDYSDPVGLEIPARPPTVSILHPVDGHTYVAGQTLRLWGAATEPGGPTASDAKASWFLGKTQIADGLDAWTILKPGKHLLTLEVEGAAGTASAQVSVEVVEMPKAER